jgi:uncharacterized protein (TIGR00251 family)
MAAPSRIRLRVTPGAARSRVVGRHGDGWKVRVAAPAENGKANDALVRLLADWLGLPRTGVELVSGHTRRDKIVELSGIDGAEARRRLATAEEAR